MSVAVGRTPVRAVVANRPLVRMLATYTASSISEWSLWVAALVYAFEQSGAATAGFASIALLVPAGLVAPLSGRAADGSRPERVLLATYLLQGASLAATAGLAVAGAPAAAVIAGSAVAIAAIAFVRPAVAVIVPGLVVAPSDLVAANLLIGNADSLSVLAGPLLASALVSIDGPALVIATCAAINGGCAIATWTVARRRTVLPFACSDQPCPPRPGAIAGLVVVWRAMASQAGSMSLLFVLGAQYALIGALDLLVVNLAYSVFELGGWGPGLLSASFGVGAVLGGFASALVIGRQRLALVMIVALAVIATAMLVLGGWTILPVALIALPVIGISRTLLDVSGRSLLQRCAPQHVLASVFALLEALAGVGILCGSLLVQILVGVDGVRTAVFGLATFFLIAVAVAAPSLRHADDHADAPVVEIRLLRSTVLFASLPGPVLEAVARTASLLHYPPGTVVVREGEVGDCYYVVADGEVEVSVDGVVQRTMQRGEGLGEIALLAGVPRTATVVTRKPASILTVDRTTFLEAVGGHDACTRIAWTIARSLHPALATEGD